MIDLATAEPPEKKVIVTKVTLQERYLLLTALIAELKELKKKRRVFVDKDSAQRGSLYRFTQKPSEMYTGVAAIIGDIVDLIHYQGDVVLDEELTALIAEADKYASRIQMIYTRVGASVAAWPPRHSRNTIHEQAHRMARTLGIMSRESGPMRHYRTERACGRAQSTHLG